MCGCRGGRVLGGGSAGTVITPQTPQEINERNEIIELPPEIIELPPEIIELPPVEPLAPAPLAPAPLAPERSKPVAPKPQPVKANPIISSPKPSAAATPFSPTVKTEATKLPPLKTEKPTPKIAEGERVVIEDNDDKPKGWCATKNSGVAGSCEAEAVGTNWPQLIYYWLFIIFALIFGWIVYDITQGLLKERRLRREEENKAKEAQKKLIKKKTKRASKKVPKKK